MKKIVILVLFLISNKTEAQEIEMREENDELVALLTSTIPLQLEPHLFSTNAIVMIPKDTLVSPDYVFSFFYNSPEEITLDTTCEVEIRFWDGTLFSFPYFKHRNRYVIKDSTACFQVFISSDCIQKMKDMPVRYYIFNTPLYQHKITIEDKAKMLMPLLTRYILKKQDEEYTILSQKRKDSNPLLVCYTNRGSR